MFGLDYATLAQYAMPIVTVALLVKLFFKADDTIQSAKAKAQNVSAKMKAFGLKKIPAIIDSFVLSTPTKTISDLAKGIEALSEDGAIMRELEEAFKNVLDAKVRTPEGLAYIRSVIENVNKQAAANV